MKYADLLKTAEWKNFRADFIASLGDDPACMDCEREIKTGLHVHHRVYFPNRFPWQYRFDELRLICADCHKLIHETESKMTALIRSLPPHVCYEINDFLAELQAADPGQIKIVFARAKNKARSIIFHGFPLS